MSLLTVAGLYVDLGGAPIVRGVDLSIDAGEVLVLLGPSGCGKTTTLRAIAGLEQARAGSITLDGRELSGVPAHRRGLGLVFQEGALFGHLNVAGNLRFGLTGDSSARVSEMLKLLRLDGLADRGVHELSGGQRQRVALGRALAPNPPLLLMDEPFGSLDTALRIELRTEFFALAREAGTAVLLVTHDQDEAAAVGDRVALMCEGCIEQMGPPEALRRQPESPFVAEFMGAAALLPGSGGAVVTCPEDLVFDKAGALHGTVLRHAHAGGIPLAIVKIGEVEVRVMAPDAPPVGSACRLRRVREGHVMSDG